MNKRIDKKTTGPSEGYSKIPKSLKAYKEELKKLTHLEKALLCSEDHSELESLSHQIIHTKLAIIQRFAEKSDIASLISFKELYLSLTSALRNTEAFFCYLNFYKIGHFDLQLFREWMRSLTERKQFILADQLMETVSTRMRVNSLWTDEVNEEMAAAEDNLLKAIQKALAEEFYSQAFYVGRMDNSDSKNSSDPDFGISADEFDEIKSLSFKQYFKECLYQLVEIPIEPNQRLKEITSQLIPENKTQSEIPSSQTNLRKRKRLSDLINKVNASKIKIFVDRSVRQKFVPQTKERAYEYAFLCTKYRDHLVQTHPVLAHEDKIMFELTEESKSKLKEKLMSAKRRPFIDANRQKKERRRVTDTWLDKRKLAKRPLISEPIEFDENTQFNVCDKIRRLSNALNKDWQVSHPPEQSSVSLIGTESDSQSRSLTHHISLPEISKTEMVDLPKLEPIAEGKISVTKPPPRL